MSMDLITSGMKCLVLNIGQEFDIPARNWDDPMLAALRPLAGAGGRLPGKHGAFNVEVAHCPGGSLFTLFRAGKPILTGGVAWTETGASIIWEYLEKMYLDLSDQFQQMMAAEHAPALPSQLPWLGLVWHPCFVISAGGETSWLGIFARNYAWALLQAKLSLRP